MTLEGLRELDGDALRRLSGRVDGLIDDEGITYNALDAIPPQHLDPVEPGPWRLDPLPVLFGTEEWEALAKGVAQRSQLLDAVLKDFYGEQRIVGTGLVPPEVLFAHPGYIRRAVGVPSPGPRSLFLHAADVGRPAGAGADGSGPYAVYADRTQAPSGVGYALADRRVTSRALPREFRAEMPRPVSSFAAALRVQLLESAPPGAQDPTVVVLSPGSFSETAFDQAYLASVLGFPLVEASDLTVRDGGLYMRALGRMKRVDVVLRRVDSEFSDPLDLRTDSRLGVVGLVEMMTRGAVTVVNTLGSGVLENPALHAYLPELCRALLDEDLLLDSTPTLHAATPAGRAALDGPLDDALVIDFATGEQVVGGRLTAAQAETLRARIAADPTVWCVKTLVPFATEPALDRGVEVVDRGFGLRVFSLGQEAGYSVLSGGLGQVLLDGDEGARMHSSRARDVWVPAGEEARAVRVTTQSPRVTAIAASGPVATPRVLSDQFWIGRYAERAEAMVRLLTVAHDRNQEFRHRPWQPGAAALQPLLDAVVEVSVTEELGRIVVEGAEQSDVVSCLRRRTLDPDVPGTVAHSGIRLRACLRAVRDQMSTDTWLVLSGAERSLGRLAAVRGDEGDQLDQTLGEVLVSLLAFSGLARESHVEDPGWLMMDAGRRIERALQLCALTASVVVPEAEPEVEAGMLDAYLVAGESAVTYRRRHRAVLRVGAAVDLMFFDATNPRSLTFQLDALAHDLQRQPDELRSAAAERVVTDLQARLRRFDTADAETVTDGRRAELSGLLDAVTDGLREVSDVLERTRFALPAEARPIWVGVPAWA
ncbi:circularly permuted type 2 ATP-grasp protein [Tsukamurella sp. 1534]|uniref:circularly permuted type 2 ATP-grasp protein n=1 Tax=Tsukamurella sp. 1534 TaxID=1151061 RepID=UPI0002FE54C4|nr:circularly permuted type 2 ATP-grasp protein [Tsukamurella sp. 1534]